MQDCPVQRDLFEHLTATRRLYTAAVRDLERSEVPANDDVFNNVEASRLAYIAARAALLAHHEEHECENSD
jgi:hypothetical protein